MSGELLLGLITFCAVTAFTPGPNNAMLMASGLNFGWRRSMPHILGVALGFAFMVLVVGLGVGRMFDVVPGLYTALRIVSIAYLLWLAWRIAQAGAPEEVASSQRPLTFLEAALFQWVNPKGWTMALGATTTYAVVGAVTQSAALAATIFGVIGIASSTAWAFFGVGLRRLLRRPDLIRKVNWLLAATLVLSLVPAVRDLVRHVV